MEYGGSYEAESIVIEADSTRFGRRVCRRQRERLSVFFYNDDESSKFLGDFHPEDCRSGSEAAEMQFIETARRSRL